LILYLDILFILISIMFFSIESLSFKKYSDRPFILFLRLKLGFIKLLLTSFEMCHTLKRRKNTL